MFCDFNADIPFTLVTSVVSAEVPGSPGIQESQAGIYRCTVTSPNVPGFVDSVEVNVTVISEYTVLHIVLFSNSLTQFLLRYFSLSNSLPLSSSLLFPPLALLFLPSLFFFFPSLTFHITAPEGPYSSAFVRVSILEFPKIAIISEFPPDLDPQIFLNFSVNPLVRKSLLLLLTKELAHFFLQALSTIPEDLEGVQTVSCEFVTPYVPLHARVELLYSRHH